MLDKHTQGYNGKVRVYNAEYLDESCKRIGLAIDARKQKYPDEEAYEYKPFRGREDDPALKYVGVEQMQGYWRKDIVI